MTDPLASPVLSETTTPAPVGFMPSSVSAREYRARQQADRIIKEFMEKFTEKSFFPLDGEEMLFSLLPQLTDWPADLQLKVVNEHGDTIATYLKGSDPSVIQNSVCVVQDRYGEYPTASLDGAEELFPLIIRQLPAGCGLGKGGNFDQGHSTAGRIVTLREQLVGLLKAEHTSVFEALLADDARMKCDTSFSQHNRFLPLWTQPLDRSPVLNMLMALPLEAPSGRLSVLLEQSLLSEVQEREFLAEGNLPDEFVDALNLSLNEWRKDRGLDGIFHTRAYNDDADVLARTSAQGVLKSLLGYELLISEMDGGGRHFTDFEQSTTSILLLHNGNGNYSVKNFSGDEVTPFNAGTDSFYRAIAFVLQPHERLSLGMQSATDVEGFRLVLGNIAATANGGWYDTKNALQANTELFPDWLKNSLPAEKLIWGTELQNYRQALIEAQAPNLVKLNQYLDVGKMHVYVRNLIRNRLDFDLGLRLEPDEITVVTTEMQPTGTWVGPPDFITGGGMPLPGNDYEIITTRRSLQQLCLENLSYFDTDFRLTARFVDKHDHPIPSLNGSYVLELVRELNVGANYTAFLKQRLLTSSLAQWARDKYAQVMDAQMRLDAIEARMAGDFTPRGGLPDNLAHRGYKWVLAALDRASDSGASAQVENHRIHVQALKLKDLTSHDPLDGFSATSALLRQVDGLTLQGVLLISPESQSVSGVVVYTPSAPDSVSFREYGSEAEMQRQLFNNPRLSAYLIDRVPVEKQSPLRELLGTLANQKHLKIQASPFSTDNIFFASYETEVQRVIDQVDAQTVSTGETDWKTAWNIASSLAELALEFAPFKVRLPLAAVRSIYAISQGARAAGNGESSAVLHFVQAGLLLADGFPGAKRVKASRGASGILTSKKALVAAPEGLTLRSDGIHRGVYEKINVNRPSDFYVQSEGKTFSVHYDSPNATWRVIDPRRPDAFYKVPISIDAKGHWDYDPVGLLGGAPGKGERKALKAKKNAEASGKPAASSSVNQPLSGAKNAELFTDGYTKSNAFKKAVKSTKFSDVELKTAVDACIDKYRLDRKAQNPHLYSGGGILSLDLTLGQSTGRGNWRLLLQKIKFESEDPTVMVFFSVVDHKFPPIKIQTVTLKSPAELAKHMS